MAAVQQSNSGEGTAHVDPHIQHAGAAPQGIDLDGLVRQRRRHGKQQRHRHPVNNSLALEEKKPGK